jgi:5-oxoprolinase (ATP-hydrolysing) subunit A
MFIDLNCDLGEGAGSDLEILPLITTANVACGFHAGDPATAMATIEAAVKYGVRVGAHPSFPDREHFGRRELVRSEKAIFDDCVYQIGALEGLARAAGTSLSHVKPHGALYNQAVRDPACARPIIAAAGLFSLPIMALPSSEIAKLAPDRFIREGFADRRYRPDGSLVPRTESNAMIGQPAEAAEQALRLVSDHGVQTLCVHGDNPHAVAFVRALREALSAAGFTIRAFA